MLDLRLCGGVEVEAGGQVLPEPLIGGRQGRLVLAYLVCERDRAVRREELADLLWPERLPESWTASLSAVISRLRRLFAEAGLDGSSVVVSTPGAYQLVLPVESRVDLEELVAAVGEAEAAAASGETDRACAAAAGADAIAARGFLGDDCEWVDARRDAIRGLRARAAIAQSVAHLGARAPGRAVQAARRAVELDGATEAAYRQLMLALAAAGERAEALRVWERCRIALVEELGVDPSPETEAVYLGLLDERPPAPAGLPSGVVTFLLTDIVESSALWEDDAAAMATALERHDAIVSSVVAAHGGTLLKSKLEGDATVSVFARATECAAAALALLDAMESEAWPEGACPRLRMAMHTGEAFERGGDYFGPALNRAARLRSLAAASEVLMSQAVAELVRDHLPGDVVLRDRGMQHLRGLSRGENVFELTRTAAGRTGDGSGVLVAEELVRPPVPAVLTGTGPFVGRSNELDALSDLWQRTTAGEPGAVFLGGEPGVGKSRLAGEIAQRAHGEGALVLYGRCDEDLGAPLQPFIEAARALAPAVGAARLRAVRGVDELTRVLPELTELLGEKPGVRADPDTERLALFDAMTQLLVATSNDVPVLFVLDDLHWAGKTTLSLLRHVLRGAKGSRLLVIGTYRDTELARTHPLTETLADLRRETDTHRITLGGLAEAEVAAYLAAIGNTDGALGRELAEVTAGNPFFMIEVVRNVEESGGSWQPGTLPEGVREATGRRLSRLSESANEALAVAAVAGATFDLALVEQVRGIELLDPIAEAVHAGLVVEEPGSFARFRFAHAIVRQVLLAELVSLKRVRLHRTIAELLEATPTSADPDERLADLAYHWFECAAAGSADKAVDACRRAADRAMERLAYEEASDLYGMALQALEWIDGADAEIAAELHLARCDALLTAGDVGAAREAIDALELAAAGSERLAAWYTTYEGLLAVLGEPERLTEIVQSIGAAAGAMRDVGDLRGEAKARYVHAAALERLGQIGAAQRALDAALAAARSAGDRRLADAILAGAPPAALWGPRPIMRASGDCLDVVRVLRITSGTPAVEAVALRCQAVLEALRGRMDAARRLIASSRRTVEQLGLTHRRLEAEFAAGLIELLDGRAAAAEELLRAAYTGLRERGLGGDAAQAGAFLGRALLLQDRIDDADEMALAAEELAGADLKAAITWREVRAEVAARRGETDRAHTLAREAVEIATTTDALLLVATARLTLAGVLRTAGDERGAQAEARRALEACETKGATALASLASDAIGEMTDRAAARPAASRHEDGPELNLAARTMIRRQDAFNRGDWDELRTSRTATWKHDDRRPIVGLTAVGDAVRASEDFARAGGGQLDPTELLATRGDNVALGRTVLRAEGMEVPFLAVVRVDPDGRAAETLIFEPEAIDDALATMDRMAAANAFENDAARAVLRFEAAFNAGDWHAIAAPHTDEYSVEERRSLFRLSLDRSQFLESMRPIVDGHGRIDTEILATRGRALVLVRTTLRVPDPEAAVTALALSRVDNAGRSVQTITFDPDDLDAAFAELDRMFREGEGVEHADVLALGTAVLDAFTRLDAAAFGWLVAPGFEARDHRSLAVPHLDADQWLSSFDVAQRLHSPGGGRVEHITNLSSTGGLWSINGTGALADGGQWEIRLLLALHVADGRLASLDIFDENDVAAARAVLEERPRREVEWFENDAIRASWQVHAAFNADDWDAVEGCYADAYTMEDRRQLMGMPHTREQAMSTLRLMFDGTGTYEARETIATRGMSLVLQRTTFRVSDPEATVVVLAITEVDGTGRFRRSVILDPDDVDAALRELDGMFLEGEGAEHADVLAVGAAFLGGLARFDIDALRGMIAPQFMAHDHRSVVGGPALDMEAWLAEMSAARGVYGGTVVRVDHVTDLSSSGALWATTATGELADGGNFEMRLLLALRFSARQVVALDSFDEHDVAEARAMLRAPLSAADRFENDATRTQARYEAAFNARDWRAVVDCYAYDDTIEDRRPMARVSLDREQLIASMRSIFDAGGTFEREVVATRGRTLALTRVTLRVPAPESIATALNLARVDDAGRYAQTIVFDPDDLDAAIAELDRWFLEGEGAEHADVLTSGAAFLDGWARFDVAALRELLAPGFESCDHRLVGPPNLGVDELMVSLGDASRLYGRMAGRVEHIIELSPRGGLWVATGTGELADGGQYEIRLLLVLRVAYGRVTGCDLYDERDIDTARAALRRATRVNVEPFENDATRNLARFHAAHDARDWAALMDVLADDFTQDDRRSLIRVCSDHEESIASVRLIFNGDAVLDYEVLATRGQSLCVTRDTLSLADPETRFTVLSVCEVDATGRQQRVIMFDADDFDGALAALDRLHREAEGEGAPAGNAAWRAALRLSEAHNRRDLEGIRDVLDPACVYLDKRHGELRLQGADAVVESFRVGTSLDELSDEYTLIATRGERLALTRLLVELSDGQVGASQVELLSLVESGADDRIVALTAFEPAELDAARAALDARHAELSGAVPNVAWRAAQRLSEAQNRRDWQLALQVFDPNYVEIDHRRGVLLRLEGAAALETHRSASVLDECRDERTLIATRGDRLALTRVRVVFADREAGPSEVQALSLVECGPDGRILSNAVFNADDVDAAYAELDTRHAELSGAVPNEAWRAAQRLSDAQSRGNWQDVLDVLDPRYVYVDHRQGVRLRLEGADALEVHRTALDLDECRDERALVATRGDRLALTRNVVSFVSGSAGPSEVDVLALVECGSDGRIVRGTGFETDDLDAALAELDDRYAELSTLRGAPAGLEWFENDAWRTVLRVREAAYRRDMQSIRDANSPRVVAIDHRRGVLRLEGDDWLNASRIMLSLDEFTWDTELVATRGDRLVLTRETIRMVDGQVGPAELTTLTLLQVDEQGLQVAVEMFDADDLDAAYDALDDRWTALGAPPLHPLVKRSVDARDWDAFASLFTPDCTLVDHRTAGWGTVDKNTVVDYHRSIADLADDVHFWIDHVRSRGNVSLSAARVFGDAAGGAWEIAFITVGVMQPDGRGKYLESYEVSDLPEALERFEQLAADNAG